MARRPAGPMTSPSPGRRSVQAAPRLPASEGAGAHQLGCARATWFFVTLPFTLLRLVPHIGSILRGEAATDSGARARTARAGTAPTDPYPTATTVSAAFARDPRFDLAATAAAVIRARNVVEACRQARDPSGARQVMSDGLWRVFAMLLEERAAHDLRRLGTTHVVDTAVASVVQDRLAVELCIRLTCQGERGDVFGDTGIAVRGGPMPQTWYEYWTVRRAAGAVTPPGGGILDGRCPQCGAPLQVDANGGCGHCRSLVLAGGADWTVWNIEVPPW
jgi:hypothetical protein